MAIAEMPLVSGNPLDLLELRHRRRDSVLTQLAFAAHRHGVIRDVEALAALLARRERLGTTALGKGVVLTHARSILVSRSLWIVGRAPRGVDWGAADGEAVKLVVLRLEGLEQSATAHLARLVAAAQSLRQQRTRVRLATADADGALTLLQAGPVL